MHALRSRGKPMSSLFDTEPVKVPFQWERENEESARQTLDELLLLHQRIDTQDPVKLCWNVRGMMHPITAQTVLSPRCRLPLARISIARSINMLRRIDELLLLAQVEGKG